MIIAVLEWIGKLSTILAMTGIGWTTTNPIIGFIWLAVKSQVMAPQKNLDRFNQRFNLTDQSNF